MSEENSPNNLQWSRFFWETAPAPQNVVHRPIGLGVRVLARTQNFGTFSGLSQSSFSHSDANL